VDPETVKALTQLPLYGILIFLLYRESGAKEKLLAQLLEQAKQHAENLVQMACHGYFDQPDKKDLDASNKTNKL
jgi:hypothetical protein